MASNQLVVSTEAPNGNPVLGMIARRSYTMRGGSLVERAQDPWHLHADDLLGLFRPTTDVALEGSAHSQRGPVTRLTTELAVGPVRRRVDVIGDRSLCVGTNGALSETSPKSFTSMPITYERAYGGRDERAETVLERQGIARHGTLEYPRNPSGCGYHFDVERGRLQGARLPNLSDPDDPVAVDRLLACEFGDWIDRPTPATFAPIHGLLFPRMLLNKVGIFWSRCERPIREVQLGAINTTDLVVAGLDGVPDVRACNAAAPGLATARLLGNERVSLWNLHREHEHLELTLPGDVPRLLVEPPNTKTFELAPKLATVLIEPDEDRITLTWAGTMDVGGIYSPEMCAAMRSAVTWN